ncbi:Translation initiation factor IF-2 [Frankliniella fusca]|uniref:Translation initiation factor IF-2 n=1 Tax=Frankliniella fusca TaxID=407009 RepID=A0AAE1I372_9NEOP|nr:Translation initiation factor IF-2 [Frankliniella fusca]
MASLWLGVDKPKSNEYLRPFVGKCLELATVGVDYSVRGNKRNIKFRAVMCIADSVARPAIRNSTLFSGKFGCGICLHPGEWTVKGKGGMMSYSPYHEEQWTGDNNSVWYARRTHAQTMIDAEEAETEALFSLELLANQSSPMPWFDTINCLDADAMHIIMNIGKTFCKNEGKPFNISDKMNQVYTRLKSFHPINRQV